MVGYSCHENTLFTDLSPALVERPSLGVLSRSPYALVAALADIVMRLYGPLSPQTPHHIFQLIAVAIFNLQLSAWAFVV